MMILALVLSWLLFGLVVGLLARAIYPGSQPMGLLTTAGLGIVGSFAGGLLGNLVVGRPAFAFHGAGLLGSVIGALLVMIITGVRRSSVRV